MRLQHVKIIGLNGAVNKLQMRLDSHFPIFSGFAALQQTIQHGQAPVIGPAVNTEAAFGIEQVPFKPIQFPCVCTEPDRPQTGKLFFQNLKVTHDAFFAKSQRLCIRC